MTFKLPSFQTLKPPKVCTHASISSVIQSFFPPKFQVIELSFSSFKRKLKNVKSSNDSKPASNYHQTLKSKTFNTFWCNTNNLSLCTHTYTSVTLLLKIHHINQICWESTSSWREYQLLSNKPKRFTKLPECAITSHGKEVWCNKTWTLCTHLSYSLVMNPNLGQLEKLSTWACSLRWDLSKEPPISSKLHM